MRFGCATAVDGRIESHNKGLGMNEHDYKLIEQRLGLSRREFLKFCTGVAATLGLAGMEMRFAEAVANPQRPVVIWLSGQ